MRDLVGKYAELTLAADSYRAAGLPVPFELHQAIQRFESRARQRLSPQQMRAAMEHVEAAKVRILDEEQAQQQQKQQDKADQIIRDMTRGMTGQAEGLTQAQLAAVRAGKPIRVPGSGSVFDRKRADARVREETKRFDPEGRGYSLKQWESRLEEFATADDAKLSRLAKQYGVPVDEARQLAGRWKSERYDYEMRKRNSLPAAPKDEVYKPSDEESRRATIVDAYVNTVDTDRKEEMDQLFGSITEESLEDDDRRGDIARAFAQVEERDNAI